VRLFSAYCSEKFSAYLSTTNGPLEVLKWVFVYYVAKEQIVAVLVVQISFAINVASIILIVQNVGPQNLNTWNQEEVGRIV